MIPWNRCDHCGEVIYFIENEKGEIETQCVNCEEQRMQSEEIERRAR